MSRLLIVALIISFCCCLFSTVDAFSAQVPMIRELTDANFEDVTQAATPGGSTTGSWFVLFYAPWCSHCKSAMPEFEKFAGALFPAHGVQGARVDCSDAGAKTCRRFKVKSYPTFLLFKGGKLYSYGGYKRDADSMTGFAREVPSKVEAWAAIPKPIGFLEDVVYWAELIGEDFNRLSGENPLLLWTLLGACGILFLLILVLAVSSPKKLPVSQPKKKQTAKPEVNKKND
jgi:thioredoxin domain-containing protein 5